MYYLVKSAFFGGGGRGGGGGCFRHHGDHKVQQNSDLPPTDLIRWLHGISKRDANLAKRVWSSVMIKKDLFLAGRGFTFQRPENRVVLP